MNKLVNDQYFSLNIYQEDKKNKYILHVLDSQNEQILSRNSCGIFITPQGKEITFLFGNREGQKMLLNQTKLSRLIIVHINYGFIITSLQEIQDELNQIIKDVIPLKCSNQPVPYMTDGDYLGEKSIIYENNEYLIEELRLENDGVYRRLIDKQCIDQIQSQVRLKHHKKEQGQDYNSIKKIKQYQQSIMEIHDGYYIDIDEGYLDFDCHKAIFCGMSLLQDIDNKEQIQILILGGGIGALSSFLFRHIKNTQITTVELSGEVISIAKDLFNFEEKPNFKIIQDDALNYIKNTQQVYDIVILDINSYQQYEMSPPSSFVNDQSIKQLQNIIRDQGLLIINSITHNSNQYQQIISNINQQFHICFTNKLEREKNIVIYAINTQFQFQENNLVIDQDQILTKKDIQDNFKLFSNNLLNQFDQTMNLQEYLTSIQLQFPISKNLFQHSNFSIQDQNQNLINNNKEAYILDKKKMNKERKKQKKNKVK